MKVKMRATMRTLTRKGIVLLAKKTDAAAKAYEKAFLPPLTAQVAAGNIVAAETKLPRSEAASEVWEASETAVTVYRDSLYLVALELTKTVEREQEYENPDAAADTKEQLDEVVAQLRQLGDQRDLFEEEDGEEDDSQLDLASAGKSKEEE